MGNNVYKDLYKEADAVIREAAKRNPLSKTLNDYVARYPQPVEAKNEDNN